MPPISKSRAVLRVQDQGGKICPLGIGYGRATGGGVAVPESALLKRHPYQFNLIEGYFGPGRRAARIHY